LVDDRLSRPELSARARLPLPTRVLWPLAAGMAAAAASTLTTAGAAAAAGRQADLALRPIELALRVGLLLVAPCAGALLAAVAIPRGGRPVLAAVGVGVPLGPLLVLRLDRMDEFGLVPIVLTVALLVLWGTAGILLAAGWWGRSDRTVERTVLPGADPVLPGADPVLPGAGSDRTAEGATLPSDSPSPPGGAGAPQVPRPPPTEASHQPRAG
jgi:hypothetical protein